MGFNSGFKWLNIYRSQEYFGKMYRWQAKHISSTYFPYVPQFLEPGNHKCYIIRLLVCLK